MRRLAPVTALFFLSPLVAEFFLGDLPIVLLPLIVALAPMYGGGAILIRELTRRAHRGWPTMLTLGLAFGVLNEGLLTQSLFNPNYSDSNLLSFGFVPSLGIAVPWTVFVLTLHAIWSIATPVAIVEESAHHRQTQPWLRAKGLVVASALFVIGAVITFAISYGDSKHFVAKPAQLEVSAAITVALVAVAFLLPRVDARATRRSGFVPNPWLLLMITLAAGVAFMETTLAVWIAVALMLIAPAGVAVLTLRWSARESFGPWHRLALASGALFTYSWHAFTMGGGHPSTAEVVIDLISHVIFAFGALCIVGIAIRRIRLQRNDVLVADEVKAPEPAVVS